MIPVEIDTREIVTGFGLSKDQTKDMVDFVVKQVTAVTAKEWDNEARVKLRSTRDIYRNSIRVVDAGRFVGVVKLLADSPLPNMLESGADPFDLKKGLQYGKKVKIKKDGGWYTTVPFRFATAGSLGESSIFSGVLPQPVQEAVKKKGFFNPLKMGDIPEPYQIPRVQPVKLKSGAFTEYEHKSSIYEGLMRSSKKYEKVTQSQYVTFRRVSDKSDPFSWRHPGLHALNLADKALERINIEEQIGESTNKYLEKAGLL